MNQRNHESRITATKNGNSYLPMNFVIGNPELVQAVFVKLNKEKISKRKSF